MRFSWPSSTRSLLRNTQTHTPGPYTSLTQRLNSHATPPVQECTLTARKLCFSVNDAKSWGKTIQQILSLSVIYCVAMNLFPRNKPNYHIELTSITLGHTDERSSSSCQFNANRNESWFANVQKKISSGRCALFARIFCICLPAGDPSDSLPHWSISPSPLISMEMVSWVTGWPAPVVGWHSGCEGGQEVGGRRDDSHDAGMKMDQHCSATYERLWKALFEEDAGRAHDVVQHVAVLDQGAEGVPEQLVLLHVLIAVSPRLLAHRPHLPTHSPLQRHTPVSPPPPAPPCPTDWNTITSFKEEEPPSSGHAHTRQNVAVT